MKSISDYLIQEAKIIPLDKVQYSLIAVYENNIDGYVFNSIKEIETLYKDEWQIDEKYLDEIIKKVNDLNIGECFINNSNYNKDTKEGYSYEIISKIK